MASSTHETTPQGFKAVSVETTLRGRKIRVLRKDLEADDLDGSQDPFFFDADYDVAASTGMVVWEGSWALVEALADPDSWVSAKLRGARVVELGAGTGLLGLCAAVAGADVLMTDVPAVVSEMLAPNLAANADGDAAGGGAPWARVGDGSAAAAPLDWHRAVDDPAQLAASHGADPRDAEVVLAAECVWLKDLVAPFVETVVALLRGPKRPSCVLSFRERANDGATGAFAAGAAVMAEFAARGCDVREHGPIGTAHRATLYEITLRSRGGEN